MGRHVLYWESYNAALKPRYRSEYFLNSTVANIVTIDSRETTYDKYRNDPIFPAIQIGQSQPLRANSSTYWNNDTYPALLACSDTTVICDASRSHCTGAPSRIFTSYNISQEFDFKAGPLTEAELAFSLLYFALQRSFFAAFPDLEIPFFCKFIASEYICFNVPQDQWIAEVRGWFKISLANIQVSLLDIVQGTLNKGEDFQDIAPNYRGMCQMLKYRTVGWRNVSAAGFWSLLVLAAGVSIASVRTEKEELWLVVGARRLSHFVR